MRGSEQATQAATVGERLAELRTRLGLAQLSRVGPEEYEAVVAIVWYGRAQLGPSHFSEVRWNVEICSRGGRQFRVGVSYAFEVDGLIPLEFTLEPARIVQHPPSAEAAGQRVPRRHLPSPGAERIGWTVDQQFLS
jgi:hypothetical protein